MGEVHLPSGPGRAVPTPCPKMGHLQRPSACPLPSPPGKGPWGEGEHLLCSVQLLGLGSLFLKSERAVLRPGVGESKDREAWGREGARAWVWAVILSAAI